MLDEPLPVIKASNLSCAVLLSARCTATNISNVYRSVPLCIAKSNCISVGIKIATGKFIALSGTVS
jgi:hypothetical protein